MDFKQIQELIVNKSNIGEVSLEKRLSYHHQAKEENITQVVAAQFLLLTSAG